MKKFLNSLSKRINPSGQTNGNAKREAGAKKLKDPVNEPDVPLLSLELGCRLLYEKRLMEMVNDLEGDVVECGIGRGRSFLLWAILCVDEGKQRRLWGFDSFEGLPEPTSHDESPRKAKKGLLNYTTVQGIISLLMAAGVSQAHIRSRINIVRGFFEDSLSKYTGEKIAILHIDADLYQSYKTIFELLYEKVVPGGIIALDEYMGTVEYEYWPGAREAIDEFITEKNLSVSRDEAFGKYYIVKPRL